MRRRRFGRLAVSGSTPKSSGLKQISAARFAIVGVQALAAPPVELAVERVVELAEATMLPLPRIVTL